jgi:hypothetical protein
MQSMLMVELANVRAAELVQQRAAGVDRDGAHRRDAEARHAARYWSREHARDEQPVRRASLGAGRV